jgi:2-(1,2-epoxy-1,2-dihydrophenyl)acetyl-CoA isomerase
MSDPVLLEVRDGIAHLTLNRPDAANGIDLALARALLARVEELPARPDARVVLLTGAGSRFCAGGDLKEFVMHLDDGEAHLRAVTAPLHAAVSLLVDGALPVVAAVQGSAAGAGMGLVGAADLVVAAASAKFVMAYTGVGLTPDGGSSWFLPRLVGTRRALELALTNRVLGAAEALEWGLVTSVVPDDELLDEGLELAARLAEGPTGAYAGARRLLRAASGASLDEQLAAEVEEIASAVTASDGREGITAFAEKRSPRFRGR